MSLKLIIYTLGNLLICLAGTMLFPLGVAIYYRTSTGEAHNDLVAFVISAVITLMTGLILRYSLRARQEELGIREGFAVVALAWVTVALFGALPYQLAGVFHIDGRSPWTAFSFCYFESMAGFSTTGATVLTEIEHLSHAMLFWRSFTHWLGGMGIVVLAVAILPMLGIGGMQLFRAEAPGPQTDRLTPRIAQTAKLLWGVYVLLSILEVILLMFGKMTLFDALCHTFGTMATGGFSTKNASIGHYNSVYIDMVICVFMFLAGTNFALHYRALRGNVKAYFQDTEFKFYCTVIAIGITLISWNTIRFQVNGEIPYDSMWTSLRYATFQVLSIITTTGYGTADFEQWPALSQFILITLMFYGGCAGSTGGGMKQVRFLLLIKQSGAEIKRLIFPPRAAFFSKPASRVGKLLRCKGSGARPFEVNSCTQREVLQGGAAFLHLLCRHFRVLGSLFAHRGLTGHLRLGQSVAPIERKAGEHEQANHKTRQACPGFPCCGLHRELLLLEESSGVTVESGHAACP